jgi:prepilin-type N-terminal cleavage/methylation domain-containing protein
MRAGAKDSRGGFTLIELLLVISIILLLVSILVVAVSPKSTQNVIAVKRMDSLAAAADAFRNVFGVYPPSNSKAGFGATGAPSYGAQCLYYYLKGPADANGVCHGWSPSSNPPVAAEYSWEGAMNVNNDWVTTPTGYNGRPYFNDGIQGGDRAILYYRAASKVGQAQSGSVDGQLLASTTSSIGLYNYYNYNDNCDTSANPGSDSPFWPNNNLSTVPSGWQSKQAQWENEATDWNNSTATAAAQRYPQRPMSYIMISAGLDREFGLPSDPSRGWASDDITNYSP